jgi:hypothetical protein
MEESSSPIEMLEEVLQTLLQAQKDLTDAREMLDGCVERLHFHGELKWRNAAGEIAAQIEGHADRRRAAIGLVLDLQQSGPSLEQ